MKFAGAPPNCRPPEQVPQDLADRNDLERDGPPSFMS
jgi:hypothetical protein